MKISAVCRRTGLTKRTVRFYLECGLISPAVEFRNGRYYKEYSEADLRRLETVAGLRRARFSVSQIRSMLDAPETIPEVYSQYMHELRELAGAVARLLHTASGIEISRIGSADELCGALAPAAEKLPLPRRDVHPDFSRLDGPEFAESAKTAEFHRRQYKNEAGAVGITGSSAGYNTASGLTPGDLNLAGYAVMRSGVLAMSRRNQRTVIILTAAVAILLVIGAICAAIHTSSGVYDAVMVHDGCSYYCRSRSLTTEIPERAQLAGVLEYGENHDFTTMYRSVTVRFDDSDFRLNTGTEHSVALDGLELWAVAGRENKYWLKLPSASPYAPDMYVLFRRHNIY